MIDLDRIALEEFVRCDTYVAPLNDEATANELGFFAHALLARLEREAYTLVPNDLPDEVRHYMWRVGYNHPQEYWDALKKALLAAAPKVTK